jgi:predicted Zn-dependent protease
VTFWSCRTPKIESREDHLRTAEAAMARADYLAAGDAYRKASAIGPPDGYLLAKQAKAYANAWVFRSATDPARRAADLLPHDLEVQLLAAEVLLHERGYDEVASRMATLLATEASNVDVLIAFGNARARMNSSEETVGWLVVSPLVDDVGKLASGVRQRATRDADVDAEAAFRNALRLSPGAVSTQQALANFLFATGRFDEFESVLRGLADAHPSDGMVNHALGSYYMRQGRHSDAEPYLRRASSNAEYKFHDNASRMLADAYAALGRDPEAIAVLSALAKEQADVELTLRLARLELRSGSRDEALKRLDTLVAQQPPVVEAATLKARALLQDRPFEAVQTARVVVGSSPTSSEARALLGEALAATGDLENAYDEYAMAVQRDPSASAPVLALANLALSIGDSEALLFARDAARLNPQDTDAALLPLRALTGSRDFRGADEELRRLRRTKLDSPAVNLAVGELELARGRPRDARISLERAARAMPDSTAVVAALAAADLADNQPNVAARRLATALASHSDDPALLSASASVYASLGDQVRKEAALRHALDVEPANTKVLLALVTPEFISGRGAEARRLIEQLLTTRPRAHAARILLAELDERQGRTAQAMAHYEEILKESRRRAGDPIIVKASARLGALRSGRSALPPPAVPK